VLALLKGRRVSLGEASRRLSPKCSLLENGIRTYTACDALVLVISNKDKQYNINTAYTLLGYLRKKLNLLSSLSLMFSFQKKRERYGK
jgi:hypothetical protein